MSKENLTFITEKEIEELGYQQLPEDMEDEDITPEENLPEGE